MIGVGPTASYSFIRLSTGGSRGELIFSRMADVGFLTREFVLPVSLEIGQMP